MTDDLTALRSKHVGEDVIRSIAELFGPSGKVCKECGQEFPCDASKALDRLEQAEALIDRMTGSQKFFSLLTDAIARAERAEAAIERVRALADQWNGTPDYKPSEYDLGRVEQRHEMTEQLLAALDTGKEEP